MKLTCFFLLILGCLGCREKKGIESFDVQRSEISIVSELDAFHDVRSLPRYHEDVIDAQVSSYDTTWKNDDGFNGTYSFLRRNADSTLVIFDVTGSGVINRIWTPTPTDDTLDFYIDSDSITFSIPYSDLFSGKQYPFIAPLCGNQLGGFYCYLPIPFQKSCKIITRGKQTQFHQIQYRLYPEGRKVKRFSMTLAADENEALKKITALWAKPEKSIHDFYENPLESFKQTDINPGSAITVFEANEGGRILGIEIGPSQTLEGLKKNLDIRITWDHENVPAVFCPVTDFFGYSFGKASMQSLLIGTHGDKNYCYFPMPFDAAAKIELVSRNTSPMRVDVRVWHSSEARRPEQEGKFYTRWYANKPERGEHHVFLDREGKGHYVGTVLQSQGLKSGMTIYFEGDDSTAIDGDFRMHGTGSEDYFNGGWYAMLDRWDSRMSLPLHGALDYQLLLGRTGGYRFFLTDKMSFQRSLYHSIEHGPVGNTFPVLYTSTAYYYADSPPATATTPTDELTTVWMPDTLVMYPQLMEYSVFGNLDIKTTWRFQTGGESYYFYPGNDSWLRVSLADIPHGSYKLYFDLQKKPDGCEFSVWQRQTQVSTWISTQANQDTQIKDLYGCDLTVGDFKNTITFRFKTDAQRNVFLLHRLILIKQ